MTERRSRLRKKPTGEPSERVSRLVKRSRARRRSRTSVPAWRAAGIPPVEPDDTDLGDSSEELVVTVLDEED
ncbi:hypothetical protein ACKI10_06870 [Streptomyces galilaeus]|uniref:hypothetical protein n=1 Tax=Streptomyces galilaeus TaxID=33899 RepID=UPI0038F7F969